jgi:carbon monoxide dehydrogenase subunit G
MAVHAEGHIVVAVVRATAFDFVGDPARLAACIPGCRDVRQLQPNRYEAALTVPVAFMTLRFTVIVELTRVDRPHVIEARMSGDSVGVAGRVAATGLIEFAEAGDARSAVHYSTDITLTGRLGGLGEPAFRSVTARFAKQFGDNLKTAIEQQGSEAGS